MISYADLWQRLTPLYDEGESKAIVRWVLDEGFGLSMSNVLCGALQMLSDEDQQRLETMMHRLEQAEPVQYVLGVAEFGGRQFRVAPGVLIPRPETAELCHIIGEGGRRDEKGNCHILDIGTGSGCIAITLALDIPGSEVTAWDISEDALEIASRNADALGAKVRFEKQDALNISPFAYSWDIIVSNPPYIDEALERGAMARNVLEYEPHEALFGPSEAPDLFYRRIGEYALQSLRPGGLLFFELNPLMAASVNDYLLSLGFHHLEIRRDQFGKQRFLKAMKI